MFPIPNQVCDDFTQLPPKELAQKGVRVVLADLDNTLVSYGETHPTQAVIDWKNALKEEGITLFILSNSRKKGRVDVFAQALDVPYQGWSGKPKKKGYRRALDTLKATPDQCLMVGDQIFTDIFGATRMNIPAILVKPIHFANVGQVLRFHILETPFRHVGSKRQYF